jgi:serine protease Do
MAREPALPRARRLARVATALLALGSAPARADGPPPPQAPLEVTQPSAPRNAPGAAPAQGALCTEGYADDFSALLPRARELETTQTSYTYCIRSTAAFECPYYGTDGVLRRTRRKVTAHGTGFGFRQQDGATLLLTNDHVAEWPAATDADHAVEGVPPGCRRVSDDLRIVESEADDYDRDDVPLSRVVVDPQLDVAVLKARALLPVIPWRVGRSAALRERNVVNVRGFPLGIFKADNVGKVVSVYDHDDYKDWDHDDFVIDALVSPGNSGSPVLAISCKTGELELVGVYHAAYTRGAGLNLVVAIDQVRDLMTTLQRSPQRRGGGQASLDEASRTQLIALAQGRLDPFFSLGPLTAEIRPRPDGRLLFEVFSRDFPTRVSPVMVIEDLPPAAAGAFGAVGRVWAGNDSGVKALDRSTLDAEAQAGISRVLDALRADALATLRYRDLVGSASVSKERFREAMRLRRSLERIVATRQDVSDLAGDLATRLGPKPAEATLSLESAILDPPALLIGSAQPPSGVAGPAAPSAPLGRAPAPAPPDPGSGGRSP